MGRTNQSAAARYVSVRVTPPTARLRVLADRADSQDRQCSSTATQSTAGAGHRIVSYHWNLGRRHDRAAVVRRRRTHLRAAGTYVVVLTVTDEVGQVGRTTIDVARRRRRGCLTAGRSNSPMEQ